MAGLYALEALIKEHEWDEICAKVNDGQLTLYGWDSHDHDLVRRPIPTPLEASVMDHPKGTGIALCIGVEVYESSEGVRCEPHFYWGVVTTLRDVARAWGVSAVRGMGAPTHATAAAEQALRAIYPPKGIPPESIPDATLCLLVNDKLKAMGGLIKSVSTVVKARKQLRSK